MSQPKDLEQSCQSSQQPTSPNSGTPIQNATGPLDLDATPDLNPEGGDHVGVPPDTPLNNNSGRNAPGLHPGTTGTEGQNRDREEREDEGAVAESDNDQLDEGKGEDAHHTPRSSRSRVPERDLGDTVLGLVAILVDVADKFLPLKAVLGVVHTNHEGTVALRNKIEALLSYIAALKQALFATDPDDAKERSCRNKLMRELEDLEKELQTLHGKFILFQVAERVQDDKEVSKILKVLLEAVDDYKRNGGKVAVTMTVPNYISGGPDPTSAGLARLLGKRPRAKL